jgi:hypothetical protein
MIGVKFDPDKPAACFFCGHKRGTGPAACAGGIGFAERDVAHGPVGR